MVSCFVCFNWVLLLAWSTLCSLAQHETKKTRHVFFAVKSHFWDITEMHMLLHCLEWQCSSLPAVLRYLLWDYYNKYILLWRNINFALPTLTEQNVHYLQYSTKCYVTPKKQYHHYKELTGQAPWLGPEGHLLCYAAQYNWCNKL